MKAICFIQEVKEGDLTIREQNFTECIISVTAYTRIPRDSCRGHAANPQGQTF